MPGIAVFDVGNTSLKFAVSQSKRLGPASVHEHDSLTPKRLIQVLKALARDSEIEGAIACSVSPINCTRLREAWRSVSRIPLLFLNHRMKLPIALKYPQPATIGPDRLAAASASYARLQKAHIVIDAGTAVTVDCIDDKGRFLGGAIAPGPAVMTEYLSSSTGLLPKMDFSGAVSKIGRSTEGAMRIGVRVGYRAMLNAIVTHLSEGAFDGRSVPLLVTGGHARKAARDLQDNAKVVHGLTLEGLAIVYELNM